MTAPTTFTNTMHRGVSTVGRATRSFVDQIGAGSRFVMATFRAMRDTKEWVPELGTMRVTEQIDALVSLTFDPMRHLVVPRVLAATTRLREVAEGLDRTEGRLSSAVAKADSVFAKVNSGRGTLGMMVNDPALYQRSYSLVRELRSLVADVKKNPKRYFHVRVF
ncbi:ABC transporter permease [Gemmatimonas sp.]|uniref:ABC transporter permease n=1 Tax=Gemmatimonas sp. TaxID=1962908 RepID=UPI00356B5977